MPVGGSQVLSRWRPRRRSFSFFFFFVIMCSLFFRYKKPHAALAMERTKPINQNT